MLEQPVPKGLHPMGGTDPCWSSLGSLSMGRTHVEEVPRGLSTVGGIPHWSRGRLRNPPPEEKEQQRQHVMS